MAPKVRTLVLAACLLTLAGSAVAAGLTPGQVGASLRAKGAKQTIGDLWNSEEWSAVEDGISSGDSAWIALAPELAPGSDAATAEGLGISLAFALPRNPAAVLAAIDMRGGHILGVGRVCGLPFIEDTEPKGYRAEVLSALSRVNSPRLRERKQSCLRTFQAALDFSDSGDVLTDVQPIPLKPGVNPVSDLSTERQDGVIVQAVHQDSDTADGTSIQFLVLVQGAGGWQTVDVRGSPLARVGQELIRAIPHAGEDWKRTVTFARAKINGTPAFVMLVAERDMSKVKTVYDPVPVDLLIYRLQPDVVAEQDHLVLVDKRRSTACYQNAWLALKDMTGVPLPADYEGPAAAAPCPK